MGEQAEEIKRAPEIEDVIYSLFNPIYFENLSESCDVSVINLYGREVWIESGDWESNSIDITEKHKVALRTVWYCSETNANTGK